MSLGALGLSLVTRTISLRTSGDCSNHFLKPGSVPYILAVSNVRTPLA